MNKYELTVVVDAKASAAKKKKVQDSIVKMVTVLSGKADKNEDWGGNVTGAFLYFPLELEPKAAKELKTKLAQEKDILRYLLIRKEE